MFVAAAAKKAHVREIVINDDRVTAVKPRPELAGFFALGCHVRGKCIELAEVTGFEPAR